MGVPRAFRTDTGTEFTNSAFVEYWNSLQIRRELTAPNTPQQNGPVESELSRAIKAGHAARIEVSRFFPDVHLEQSQGSSGPGRHQFMDVVCLVGFGRFQPLRDYGEHRHALPVRDILREPPAGAGLICKPAYDRVPRQGKLDGQARPCYFLHYGYNHGSDFMKSWTWRRGGSCTRATSHGTSRGNR